jgi:hypothetical protein
MNLEQLRGRHVRLREELVAAASSVPWNTGHVDRLSVELAAVERQLQVLEPAVLDTDAAPLAAQPTALFPPLPLGPAFRPGA